MKRLLIGALALLLASGPAHAFDNEAESPVHRTLHGHGELIEQAVKGTYYEGLAALLSSGQREQDFPVPESERLNQVPKIGLADLWQALLWGYQSDEQRKHFLRWWSGGPEWRTTTHSLEQDWQDAVGYFESELWAARAAEPDPAALKHLGHAIHGLQDSYAPAHVERDSQGFIIAMHYYPGRGPGSHAFIGDPGDRIRDGQGQYVSAAKQAIATTHELLAEYGSFHARSADDFGSFLRTFKEKNLALKP